MAEVSINFPDTENKIPGNSQREPGEGEKSASTSLEVLAVTVRHLASWFLMLTPTFHLQLQDCGCPSCHAAISQQNKECAAAPSPVLELWQPTHVIYASDIPVSVGPHAKVSICCRDGPQQDCDSWNEVYCTYCTQYPRDTEFRKNPVGGIKKPWLFVLFYFLFFLQFYFFHSFLILNLKFCLLALKTTLKATFCIASTEFSWYFLEVYIFFVFCCALCFHRGYDSSTGCTTTWRWGFLLRTGRSEPKPCTEMPRVWKGLKGFSAPALSAQTLLYYTVTWG